MRAISAALLLCGLAACVQERDTPAQDDTSAAPAIDSAVATITGDTVEDTTSAAGTAAAGGRAVVRDAGGRELGTLTAASTPEGITLTGTLSGLPPGEHGFHVHTTGRCEPPFESAGGHWNPTAKQHGEQNPQGPHVGDMLNLTVPASGVVEVAMTTRGGVLSGGATALMDADGAAVLVHAGPDDYRTDPSGNSGARIACGVIERA